MFTPESSDSESQVNKIKEKIHVLGKLCSPDDEMWQNLATNLNQLCYAKVSERVLHQPGSHFPMGCSRHVSGKQSEYVESNSNNDDFPRTQNPVRDRRGTGHICPVVEKISCESKTVLKSWTKKVPTRQRRSEAVKQNDSICELKSLGSNASCVRVPASFRETANNEIRKWTTKVTPPSIALGSSLCSPETAEPRLSVPAPTKRSVGDKENVSIRRVSQQLEVLLSEDEPDSFSSASLERKSVTTKRVLTASKNKATSKMNVPLMNVSVVLERIPIAKSKNDDSLSSRFTECSTENMQLTAFQTTTTCRSASKVRLTESGTGKKQKLEVAENNAVFESCSRTAGRTRNGSFFCDVSSVYENANVSLRRLPVEFVSPFVDNCQSNAIIATSTPTSVFPSRNSSGVRMKRSRSAAQMKQHSQPTRKRKFDHVKLDAIQFARETTARTESECEASDFSDA